MDKYITKSFLETQELGQDLAGRILATTAPAGAVVLALQGDLGAGKTTFLQGLAKGLGIKEVVNSPTFVIMHKFEIRNPKSETNSKFKIQNSKFSFFYHLDLYRLENEKDVDFLDIKEILRNPENIVAIEWPEKLASSLRAQRSNLIQIKFKHLKENVREITIDKY